MILHVVLLALFPLTSGFTLDATAHHSVELRHPIDSVRALVHNLKTLEESMPGVIEIRPEGEGRFLYRTKREIPFSAPMQIDFRIVGVFEPDGSVTWRTPGTDDHNWMSFRFVTVPVGTSTTLLSLRLRVRLVREQGTEIHVLAPLLGERFLSERMEQDLTAMLHLFGERLSRREPSFQTVRY